VEGDDTLDAFLAEVEKRAFRMARYAVGDPDDALDITQDAMIKLVSNYADRPPAEWKALFYRILQNRIRDHQRRGSVRSRVMAWLPGAGDREDTAPDPVQSAPDRAPDALPERQLEMVDVAAALDDAVAALPLRQQQAFMLRTWEGLDVAATASAMGCSQGSVKTHYSRAVRALRARLGEHYE
jgi:RNA polymerase sigma-70 factor (ECF subfamily)